MSRIWSFIKKEVVLFVAITLAVGSMFFILPDRAYISYIDFRTLAILFCMMAIVAGLKKMGLFDILAEKLLKNVHGMRGVTTILVLMCFFMSMFITNDVSLITFVPFTITILKRTGTSMDRRALIRMVVMQTIAANLGSMLTPIGNPQNLYLFGQTNMSMAQFLKLMLPYSGVALLLLLIWIWFPTYGIKQKIKPTVKALPASKIERQNLKDGHLKGNMKMYVYLGLFVMSLLVVARILSAGVLLVVVMIYTLFMDREVLKRIDYSLLATFVALFIFIGNLGRIPMFSAFLYTLVKGKEVYTAIIASQVMSNVPAAILLSKFTTHMSALIVGTNLGGLGTLIASMASLISFKYVVREDAKAAKGFFAVFTLANVMFLIVLLGVYEMM